MRLAQEIGEGRVSRGGNVGTFGYYRQPNGWITVSPATDIEELKYRREGWEPLTRYGRFEMSTEWMADHPLEPLFMRGGAHELSVEQILTQGLYLDPPLVPSCHEPLGPNHKHHNGGCWANAQPVVFPQMAGVPAALIGPFPCRFCGSDKPTLAARDQHESVAHKDEAADIRSGEVLAAALLKGLKPVETAGSSAESELEALREELAAMKARRAAVNARSRKPRKTS